MIRQYNNRTVQVENGVTKYLADIFCNSTDTKPTANLVNGSKLTEVDTGKTFLYDEADTEWVEYSAGGGGGGGGDVVFEITNLTMSPQGSNVAITSGTINTTWSELTSAINNGKRVVFHTTVSAGSGNTTVLETRITAVNYYDGAATQIVTGAILEYSLMPAAAELHLYEDELEEDVVDIRGWLITLITE